ncbi:tripartite tricarboxylate transporter substrate binding protein [soil metagenome]
MKILRNALIAGFSALTLLVSTAPAAHAQSSTAYPTKVVTLVVPFTAGSGSDIIARVIGPRLSAKWGQPVIVDNRPGASGNLGSNFVAKAQPDGYTLLMMINTFTMTPSLFANMPFDPIADFTPIARLADSNFSFVVNPAFPATDMKSLVALLKQNPGKFNYATPGNGTPHHLAMELFKSNLGVDVVHVPYKGIAGALTELMGGQVQMMFATASSVLPQVKAGKVRLLGVSGATRFALLPEVPTLREQGIDSMEGIDAWYGLMGPAHMKPDIVAKLAADFTEVMKSGEVQAELAKIGLTVNLGSAEQLAALIKTDMARWNKVVTTANIKAD